VAAAACGHYLCNGVAGGCPTSCSSVAECVSGSFCTFGTCTGLLPDGKPCTAATDCQSGNCVDGVCCDSPCNGSCFTCVATGSVGTCQQAAAGENPRGLCQGSGPCGAGCGPAGTCAYPDNQTSCAQAACLSGTLLHRASTCDGAGACVDRGDLDCAPYACSAGACPSSCAGDGACAAGFTCANGTCGLHRPAGSACLHALDCDSGFCVDAVCCQSACGGTCARCDLPPAPGGQLDGLCRAPVGEDPDGDCPGVGVCHGACKADGSCDYPDNQARCDVCIACDGKGGCSALPAADDDPACSVVACGALSSECRSYRDLAARRCVQPGLCAAANDPATCRDYLVLADGTPCAGGACRDGQCMPGADAGSAPAKPSGCAMGGASPRGLLWPLVLLGLAAVRRRRRLWWALLACAGGCDPTPLEVAERLARQEPSAGAHLRSGAGGWQREDAWLTSPGWRSARGRPGSVLGARLPLRADQPLEVGIGQSSRYTLRLMPAGARPAGVSLDGGRAIYRASHASTSTIWVAAPERIEAFFVLADAAAPSKLGWDVTLPPGLPRVARDADSGLRFVDDGGATRLRIPPAWAIDAAGVRRRARVDWDGAHLEVTLDRAGLRYPILLDPAFESGNWHQVATDIPTGRYASALAYDSARRRTVLFGGTDAGFDVFGDTWEWDGSRWALKSASGPLPRSEHAMAFDSARQRTVLFGGYTESGAYLDDTWEWDGVAWTLVAWTGPPKRNDHAMAYDAARQRTILFGGWGPGSLADTWAWDGSSWTQMMVSGPVGRRQHSMAYDSVRQRVLVFGGYPASVYPQLNDIWEWDGTTWSQGPSGPAVRAGAGLTFDPGTQRALLFGGQSCPGGTSTSCVRTNDLWAYSGTGWSQLCTTAPCNTDLPGPTQEPGFAYDSVRGRAALFGSYPSSASLWEWDGSRWLLQVGTPAAGTNSAMAWDAARGLATVVAAGETWGWDGAAWRRGSASGPSKRYNHEVAYDSTRKRLVLFGGVTAGAQTPYLGDTWEWDGTTWSQVSSTGPSPRGLHAMAYDSKNKYTLLFGGGSYNGSAVSNYGDTWRWDGSTWLRLSNTGPSARENPAMAYDAARGRMVLFGGGNAVVGPSAETGDTWEWDGTSWTQVCKVAPCSTTTPAPREATGIAFDSVRARTVIFGGYGASAPNPNGFDDSWEWDGTSWVQRASGAPSTRQGAVMAFDAARQRTVLFGGNGGTAFLSSDLGDTWEYYTHGGPCTTAAQCETGACVDGVCCEQAACGTCQACNLGTSAGTCTPVIGAADADSCAGVCDATGACVIPDGQPCDPSVPCSSGFCASGVCCGSACNRPCETCSVVPGTCSVVPLGQGSPSACGAYLCSGTSPDCPTSCAGDAVCAPGHYCAGSACVAQKPVGMSCAGARECASGFCASGLCCDRACDGACEACDATPGTCTNAAAGSAGTPSCTPYRCSGASGDCPKSCAADGDCASGYFCAAGSICQPQLAQGQACSPLTDCVEPGCRECASGFCTDGFCCASLCRDGCDVCNASPGQCTLAPAGSPGAPGCGAYLCSGSAATCPTTCAGPADCAPTFYCAGGACLPKRPAGQSCASGAECTTGFCGNAVCCAASCNLPCNRCDAAGGCGVAPAGAVSAACAGFTCNGSSANCPTSCADASGCAPGHVCILGACTQSLSAIGVPCSTFAECQSGHCADGVCCDAACTGSCVACTLPGAKGHCSQVPAGQDPRLACPGSGACKATCDASGACAYPGAERPCGAAACDGASRLHRGATCDGLGGCADRGLVDCAPYLCTGAACLTSCQDSSVCVGPNVCAGQSCGLHRPPGQGCGVASDCESGHCVDGVCCQSACDGACQRCDLPPTPGAAADGSCRITAGQDPDGDCKGDGLCSGTCLADGTCSYPTANHCDTCKVCDGTGRCNQPPASGDDDACMTVVCGGLSTQCRTFGDLTSKRCVSVGLCAAANDPTVCLEVTNQPDGTACEGGTCRAGQCVASGDAGAPPTTAPGSCAAGRGERPSPWAGIGLLWLLLRAVRRRRVAPHRSFR
jgi:hypothetical protein